MDAWHYLWAAGYTLPPETPFLLTNSAEGLQAYDVEALPKPADKPAEAAPRRGKKAARAKRERTKP